jgi:Periplasmic component of the Tol biopolymer transport system
MNSSFRRKAGRNCWRKGATSRLRWPSKGKGKWLAMNPFTIHVSKDSVDTHLTYRLIDPGYETWNQMGIYQRCLQDFTQSAIVTNEKTDRNCMNCHSFCSRDPQQMVMHMRGKNGGTYLLKGKNLEKLNTKTPQTISALVYPQWHPSGNYIAFSVNDIAQVFHSTNRNRVEVYDSAADVVLYDVRTHEVIPVPGLMQPDRMETFPSFSADGRKLIFCLSPQPKVPDGYKEIRYSICAIDFDPENRTFGDKVETLYDATATGRNAIFPRVSPDGKFLMYTESDYGCFSIWHKEADLKIMNLADGKDMDVSVLNSGDVESYHSWSSNGRWVAFSSRRMDGLYTRPFIAHIDGNGVASKPFLLPQKSTFLLRRVAQVLQYSGIHPWKSGRAGAGVRGQGNRRQGSRPDLPRKHPLILPRKIPRKHCGIGFGSMGQSHSTA